MSGSTVKEINRLRPEPDVIDYLEKLLQQAKVGEVTGIVSVISYDDGSVSNGWALPRMAYLRTIVGEIEFLKAALIAPSTENGVES